MKDSECKNAAPRASSRLQGEANAVVRRLDTAQCVRDGGLTKLLAALRASPLQQLPVPDFSKGWSVGIIGTMAVQTCSKPPMEPGKIDDEKTSQLREERWANSLSG